MFNDERINQESGKIYQRGILIATIVALIYGAVRAWYLNVQGDLSVKYLFTELFIVVCGAVILLVGALRFIKIQDERTVFEKHRYYLTAGKVFLIAALSGYALTIPFSFDKKISDLPANHLILILEVLGYVYFFYNFKNKDINFNYSFISETKRIYYGRVFANIGKLAGILGITFLISAIIDAYLHASIVTLWRIVYAYVVSVLGLGIEYLFISWVEKMIYDEEESNRLKNGIFIIGIAYVIINFFLASIKTIYFTIAFSNLQAFPGNVGEVLSSISYMRLYANYLSTVLFAMWLCYLMSQLKKDRTVKISVVGILSVSVISIILSVCSSFLSLGILDIYNNVAIVKLVLSLNSSVTYFISIIALVFTLSFAVSTLRSEKSPSLIVLIPILNGGCVICSLIARSFQLGAIIEIPLALAASVLWVVVFKIHNFSK